MTVRRKRATPRRREAPRAESGWWDWATTQLLLRCGYRCERCGQDLGNNLERHHRQRRTVGGDRLSNIVGLCSGCHAWAHAHPTEAMTIGMIVSSYAADPSAVPMTSGGIEWLLDDTGGRTRAPSTAVPS